MSAATLVTAPYEFDICPGIVSLMAPIRAILPDDLAAGEPVFAEEWQASRRFSPRRRREFLAGRWLARLAMGRLGLPASPLPRGVDGAAQWPVSVRGSISHTDAWVAVAVTTLDGIRGLGIDMEVSGAVEPSLRGRIVAAPGEDRIDLTVLFSLKEAIYKAVHPVVGEDLDYPDITVRPTPWGTYRAHVSGKLASAGPIASGVGYHVEFPGHHLTAFVVEA